MSSYIQKIAGDNDPKRILSRATFWNLISSLINAGMTAVIILVLSWNNMSEDIGVFSIATAIAYQVQAVGFFGVRNLHIADVKNEYSFSDYVWVNFISSVIMIAALVFLVMPRGYGLEKLLIVFFYTMYRALEIYEAWFHDEYQRQGRIDIGLILITIRFIVSFIFFSLVLILTKNLAAACGAALISSVIIIWIQNKPFVEKFNCKMKKVNWDHIKAIVKIGFPVCVAAYINMYLVNAGKYSIDRVLNDSYQGIFAILIVPVFTISLLSMVVYRPYISVIAQAWTDENYDEFIRKTVAMCFVILVLTIGITAFGWIIGLWLLGVVYNTDLMAWKAAFVILLLGGGLNTYAAFLAQILVIIRQQYKSLWIYIVSFIVTILSADWLVSGWTLSGAAILYALSSLILCIGSVWIIVKYTRKGMQEKKRKAEESHV